MNNESRQQVALVTGASRGFGLALARALGEEGWTLVIDARGGEPLERAAAELGRHTTVEAIPGDVTDPDHRRRLVEASTGMGGLDLLVNNASILGPSPQPILASYPVEELRRVYEVNLLAPIALIQEVLPLLRLRHGWVVNVTSDAGSEPYAGWGGYGSSKAALDQISRVLATEEPDITVFSYDPGDMNTVMHQEAFPGEDISDRPPPEQSVPPLLGLLAAGHPSGLYRRADLVVVD